MKYKIEYLKKYQLTEQDYYIRFGLWMKHKKVCFYYLRFPLSVEEAAIIITRKAIEKAMEASKNG